MDRFSQYSLTRSAVSSLKGRTLPNMLFDFDFAFTVTFLLWGFYAAFACCQKPKEEQDREYLKLSNTNLLFSNIISIFS
jgi:hypothetical protein